MTNEPFIVSNNIFWNEEIFEEKMRFPTDENYLYGEYPWIMSKLTYIKCNNIDSFLINIHNLIDMDNLVYDLCDKRYFPIKFLNKKPEQINDLVLFYENIRKNM